jgi:cytochrome c
MKLSILVFALATSLLTSVAYADGDAAAGKRVFAKCGVCHLIQPGKTLTGPSMFGVVGRHSASVEKFSYSDAMKKVDVTWDAETLDKYLTDPKAMVPGTKMTFPGLPNADDRANVIAFLATLK